MLIYITIKQFAQAPRKHFSLLFPRLRRLRCVWNFHVDFLSLALSLPLSHRVLSSILPQHLMLLSFLFADFKKRRLLNDFFVFANFMLFGFALFTIFQPVISPKHMCVLVCLYKLFNFKDFWSFFFTLLFVSPPLWWNGWAAFFSFFILFWGKPRRKTILDVTSVFWAPRMEESTSNIILWHVIFRWRVERVHGRVREARKGFFFVDLTQELKDTHTAIVCAVGRASTLLNSWLHNGSEAAQCLEETFRSSITWGGLLFGLN